jgi:hypothetical protein
LLEKEATKLPVYIDWEQDEVVGPKLRQAREEGELTGERRGERNGEHNEARRVIGRLTEKRFGPLPERVASRLDSMTTPELEELALRVDAASLNDLLG